MDENCVAICRLLPDTLVITLAIAVYLVILPGKSLVVGILVYRPILVSNAAVGMRSDQSSPCRL